MKGDAHGRRVRFAAFEVDLRSCELFKHGIRIRLQDQPFQILAIMLEQPGELIPREILRKKLWAEDTFVDFDAGLNAAIRRLRDALNDSADEPRYIETLPRHGYRFIAPVETIPEMKLELTTAAVGEALRENGSREPLLILQGESAHPPSVAVARPSKLRLIWVSALALAAGLMLVATSSSWRERLFSAHASSGIHSIAVLPLQDLSGDPNQDYFADGMTDALITNLARISSLRVISRTSAMPYKGTHKALSELARELNVDAFVEGSVVRSGNRVRINAQLIQAMPERHLWANAYERDLSDIVALEGEVTRAIASEIQIKLTPQEQAHFAVNRPVNPEAYEACLRGRYYLSKRSLEGYERSLELFEQAIQKDPTYAPAYAGLADTYNLLGLGMGALPPIEAANRARAAAMKAIELDEALPDGHSSLTFTLRRYDWNWAAAEKEEKRAMELDPGYSEAVKSIGSGVRNIAGGIARPYFEAKQYDQGIAAWRKAIDLVEPDSFRARMDLAGACLENGRYEDAIAEYQKVIALHGRNIFPLARLGYAYALSGRPDEAEKILYELKKQGRPGYPAFASAQICAALGRKEEALKWLQKAYEERSPLMFALDHESAFASLQSDSRFKELLRRIGRPAGETQ
jgi:TolB-like protein/DNA-binding winged helix-turn-helix (wHTH) protein